MSPSLSTLLTTAATAATLIVAAPASAATVESPNACRGEDGRVGNLPLQLTADATKSGRTLAASAVQPGVTVPAWLKAQLAPAGLVLGAGNHKVNLETTMALAGEGSTNAPQVRSGTGSINIAVNYLLQVTNVTVSLTPLASSTWNAADAGGPLTVKQAGPGTLGTVANAPVQPTGSLFIRGTLKAAGQTITLTFDCQPGGNGAAADVLNTTIVPGAATPIASATFDPAPGYVPPVTDPKPDPIPADPKPDPGNTAPPAGGGSTPAPGPGPGGSTLNTPIAGKLAITSTALKFGSAAVLVNVSCPTGGAACTGGGVITSAKKLKVGKKGAAKLRKLASGRYSVPAGSTTAIKLKLTADGKKLRKTKLVSIVTLKPATGTVLTKKLRANG